MDKDVQNYLQHFDRIIRKDICDYATDVALKKSRYIFTERTGKLWAAYCTHCGYEYNTTGLKHNDHHVCPNCRSMCQVKSSGMHRKNLIDRAYFVFFEKSIIDPNVIVAKGLYVIRDYSGDYRNVKTVYSLVALYVFETGSAKMLKRDYWRERWDKCSSIFSLFGHGIFAQWDINQLCSHNSIAKAVQDTPFRYSAYEDYQKKSDEIDMVGYFALYSKYPSVEYLMKLGFRDLIDTKLSGGRTYSTINWRGNTLFKVLKLNKKELNEIKAEKINVTFEFLKLLQMSKKDGSTITLKQIQDMVKVYGNQFNDLLGILDYATVGRANNYLQRQAEKNKKVFKYLWDALITWRDYISDCKKLEWNLSDESVLYPSNLHKAHQNTIKQIKIKADESLNLKIQKRLKELKEKYCFEYNGLLIRPAESSIELLDEGKALNHCVGRYADNYAKGTTNILLIRKTAEPDKPYFTVELANHEIWQVRGKSNCTPSRDVSDFVAVFEKEVLSKYKPQNQIRVNIPA